MHFIWVPAIIAMYISVFCSFVRICIIVLNWRKRVSETGRLRLIKLVRPVMMFLIIGSMAARERLANELFSKYTVEFGQSIQEICDLEGKCPKSIEGWDIVDENPTFCASESFVTKLGRKASVRYEHGVIAKRFEIFVNYGNLSIYNFRGGVRKKLKAKGNEQSIDIESEEIFDEEERKLIKKAMEASREYQKRNNKE